MASLANTLMPIYNLLLLNAANAPKLSIDNTRVKILSVMAENKDKPKNQRRGTQTNGLIAHFDDKTIVLYQSGTLSSGKRLRELMEKRISEDKFILMSEAASCNNFKGFSNIIHANCLSHARRKFFEIEDVYPEEAQIVIDAIALIYGFDTQCQIQQLTDGEKLLYHQKHSAPIMALLHQWLRLLIDSSLVDENNSLGQACKYALTHWDKLCRFMEVPGCDLDNNMLERFLKIPIRQRKNSLFFKTENGAQVGSIVTSVLTTAIENNANPMHYLSALIDNQDQILKEPQAWLPWNYDNSGSLSKEADFRLEALS